VTTGYVTALLARSRGQAPLLLPSTPSRFETDAHPLADVQHEVTVLQRRETDVGQRPAITVPEMARGEVLRGAQRPQPTSRPTGATSPAYDESISAPMHPTVAAPEADDLLMPDQRPPLHDVTPVSPRHAAPTPAHFDEQRIAAGPLDHADRSAARLAPSAAPADDAPPIVVRIGRLEVRAVQVPPVARPQPRPRPAATPTLEERLAARDRQ